MVVTNLVFVDTTVLLYEWDGSDINKHGRATEWMRRLWETQSGRISYQVLVEFYRAATQKVPTALSTAKAQNHVRTLETWKPIFTDGDVLNAAWRAQDRYKLSWWDALIVAAAQHARCRTLLSEDFQAGQQFDDVTVVNPFATAPPPAS
jgi:predicted nucleic acid-binding protein